MKKLILFLGLAAPLGAQWIVNDPVDTAVNTLIQTGQVAQHAEIIARWAEALENLNQQLRQLQEQLAVQQHIRNVIGDPVAAAAAVDLRALGATDLMRSYGETLASVRRLANAIASLQRTSEGIYRQLDNRTVLGREFVRQESLYRRYAAVERQADNLESVQAQIDGRSTALQADIAATLEQLRSASTQAEVDKLAAKLAALSGQQAHLDAQRQSESAKLDAQQIMNANQADKERQDLLECQMAEEHQTLQVVGAWQNSFKVTPTSYDRP